MSLFTSELFNATMARRLAPHAPRSYRAPAFARRYGRHADPCVATGPVPSFPPDAGALQQVGDRCVVIGYDRAA